MLIKIFIKQTISRISTLDIILKQVISFEFLWKKCANIITSYNVMLICLCLMHVYHTI